MATRNVTAADFESTVVDNDIVILDWWASWCGPCKMFAPVFEQASEDNPDLVFGKINTEEQPELQAAFDVRSIPTLMIFREKVLVYSQPGAIPAAALEDLIAQARALDMEAIHREVAAQSASN
jgi:thioredoxin